MVPSLPTNTPPPSIPTWPIDKPIDTSTTTTTTTTLDRPLLPDGTTTTAPPPPTLTQYPIGTAIPTWTLKPTNTLEGPNPSGTLLRPLLPDGNTAVTRPKPTAALPTAAVINPVQDVAHPTRNSPPPEQPEPETEHPITVKPPKVRRLAFHKLRKQKPFKERDGAVRLTLCVTNFLQLCNSDLDTIKGWGKSDFVFVLAPEHPQHKDSRIESDNMKTHKEEYKRSIEKQLAGSGYDFDVDTPPNQHAVLFPLGAEAAGWKIDKHQIIETFWGHNHGYPNAFQIQLDHERIDVSVCCVQMGVPDTDGSMDAAHITTDVHLLEALVERTFDIVLGYFDVSRLKHAVVGDVTVASHPMMDVDLETVQTQLVHPEEMVISWLTKPVTFLENCGYTRVVKPEVEAESPYEIFYLSSDCIRAVDKPNTCGGTFEVSATRPIPEKKATADEQLIAVRLNARRANPRMGEPGYREPYEYRRGG